MRYTDPDDMPTRAEANADAGIAPCECYVDRYSGPQQCEYCEARAEAEAEGLIEPEQEAWTPRSDIPVDAADFAPRGADVSTDDDLPF